MKKVFLNNIRDKCQFTDDGITIYTHSLMKQKYIPYECIKKISIGMLNVLEVVLFDGTKALFTAEKKDKNEIKELLTYVKMQANASKSGVPIETDLSKQDVSFQKNSDAIIEHFALMCNDGSRVIANELPNVISSMDSDEEIIHAFDCTNVELNDNGKIAANWPVVLITNKRLYYIGYDFYFPKSGAITGRIELKDTHAISASDTSPTNILRFSYVKFETKNDNYKFLTGPDTPKIRAKLEEAVKISKENSSGTTVVHTTISSADELMKFKGLLDMGIITQEEFDAKKKQLLGL